MAFLIGTDEAGYGPNLGPLVVSISVWRVPDCDLNCDLYDKLKDAVSDKVDRNSGGRIAVADSKKLFQPSHGLQHLESGVLTALGCLGATPDTWLSVWKRLAANVTEQFPDILWYRDYDCVVPVDADVQQTEANLSKFKSSLQDNRVELCDLKSAAVLPRPFNQMIEQHGNKAAALSTITLDLVVDAIAKLPSEPIRIVCDKHGGRNNYAPFLQPRFDDRLIRVITEGRARSAYDVGTQHQPINISFQTQGESYLPSAFASMASKYLRELAMKAFNDFWQTQVKDLRPTAGYPVDAKRFKLDIAKAQKRLKVSDQVLWRNR